MERRIMGIVEYSEYIDIINSALVDYVNKNNSTYKMFASQKEYFFDYDEKNISEDAKDRLINKAVKCINEKKTLPPGIRLVDCVMYL